MGKIIAFVLVCLIVSGCATTMTTNNLSVGMTKQEVIKVMGQPVMTKAQNNKEVLEYMLAPAGNYIASPNTPYSPVQYWVILENNRVTTYGRAGDFGTAEKADITIENKY